MSYINREEAIKRIELFQSNYTGFYFELIGKVKEIIKNVPDQLTVNQPPTACSENHNYIYIPTPIKYKE